MWKPYVKETSQSDYSQALWQYCDVCSKQLQFINANKIIFRWQCNAVNLDSWHGQWVFFTLSHHDSTVRNCNWNVQLELQLENAIIPLRGSETKTSDFSDHYFFSLSIYLLIWIRKDAAFCKSFIPAHLMGTLLWTEMAAAARLCKLPKSFWKKLRTGNF